MAKRTTKISEALRSMNKTDIYSLMLFVLYKMKEDPDYLTLTELCYILDGENLVRFLSYFGGMTIKVPDSRDLRLVFQALRLYQFVNLEQGTFEEGLRAATTEEFDKEDIKKMYAKICEAVANYDFGR